MMLVEEIETEFADHLKQPPAPRSLLDFVRSLINPTGEFKGLPYNPDMVPAQITFFQEVARALYEAYYILADTQVGKSWIIQCILFYATCELKQDVLYGLQDMRAVSDVWHLKLEKAIEGSGLADHLPTSGPGSGGGTDIDTVHLRNAGAIVFQGGHGKGKGGGVDGKSIPIIINDELDTLTEKTINKNEARADAFFIQARRFRASTVKEDDGQSNILSSIKDSTNTRIAYKCPACGEYFKFDWELVSYNKIDDDSANDTARIGCPRCSHQINEEERQQVIKNFVPLHEGQTVDSNGVISGIKPRSRKFGLSINALDNPFKTLGKTCMRHRSAVEKSDIGRNQDLIDFYHDQLGREVERVKSGEELDPVRLAELSAKSTYRRGIVPSRVIFMTGAVDQQLRELVWLVRGHDMEGRTWVVDWGIEIICAQRTEPTPAQRIQALDKVSLTMKRGWRIQDNGAIIAPVIIGIDVADWPSLVAAWIRDHPTWLALHGSGATRAKQMQRNSGKSKASLPGWYELREQDLHGGGWDYLWLSSDEIKHEVGRSFARPLGSTGSAQLPADLRSDDPLIQQMCAERWQRNEKTGKFEWMKFGRYNEGFDLVYYTQALGQYFMIENPDYVPPDYRIAQSQPRYPQQTSDEWGAAMGAW